MARLQPSGLAYMELDFPLRVHLGPMSKDPEWKKKKRCLGLSGPSSCFRVTSSKLAIMNRVLPVLLLS
jgi:hypothetical protein